MNFADRERGEEGAKKSQKYLDVISGSPLTDAASGDAALCNFSPLPKLISPDRPNATPVTPHNPDDGGGVALPPT